MEVFVFLMFFVVIGLFIIAFVRIISEWISNNNSPRLIIDATVVAKRDHVSRHNHNGHVHRSHSYYATFQFESGDRLELLMSGSEYGLLVEGDVGKLTFQGTRYLSFERKF